MPDGAGLNEHEKWPKIIVIAGVAGSLAYSLGRYTHLTYNETRYSVDLMTPIN